MTLRIQKGAVVFCILAFAFLIAGSACSIPNLESAECSLARDAVKKFYSFHFGNEMRPSAGTLKAREKFLTPDLYRSLTSLPETNSDYFTASEELPNTFKIGRCKASQPGKAELQVQIYWRDDKKTVQKEVHVETVNTGDGWLINRVSN